ncbi:MAG: TetR/AcrR family transcriptional regulator [Pseudomonadota bacterium]
MARPSDRRARPSASEPGGAEESNRRAELIRAAARLFREKGYDATTIRDIANAVGMRSGSPFYHFKSKQDMLRAVMSEGLQQALAALEQVAARPASPRDKFRGLIRAHLATILEPSADFIPVLLYEWRALDQESRAEVIAVKDRYEAIWQDCLGELKKAGLLRNDGKVERLLMFGALNWIAQWYKPGGGLSIDEIADQALEFFLCPARTK